MQKAHRKLPKVMMGVFVLMIILLIVNWGGEVEQFRDKEGHILEKSIAEKVFVDINGVKLGMFIRGKDINNPVLLFLHGGPGMPEYFLKEDYPINLEEHFTVVWLEQRGAGLSYSNKINPDSITVERFIEDDAEVTKYLCQRFNKQKVYLMAHSWGTCIGIRLVQKYSDLYEAYIPMAQMTDQEESEKLAYEYMLSYYKENGDTETLKKLQEAGFDTKAYSKIRDSVMHKAGIGTTRDMKSVIKGIFFTSLGCKEYSLVERINIWRGRLFTLNAWKNNDNEWGKNVQAITEIKVPIYFLHGKYDYTVNYDMAKAYYEKLKAPKKDFYTFENSAHSPLFEEPDKAINILVNNIIKDVESKNNSY